MTARIPAGAPPRAARITILDILRALALLGIVIVHAHDHFNLYLPMPPAEGWQAAANSAADWAYEHLFVSKSFLLFSFLFGLSFFIQLDRQEQKGIDFRKRFMWRLALLFLLGLAHTLFYDGDILTIFGVLGFALVALYKRGTPLLVILCLLCLMQPVAFMDTLSRAGLADLWPHSSGWFHPASPAAGPSREFLYAHGSWEEAALWNLTQGQAGKWQFFLLSGRIWQTLGLFIRACWRGDGRSLWTLRTSAACFCGCLESPEPCFWLCWRRACSSPPGWTPRWERTLDTFCTNGKTSPIPRPSSPPPSCCSPIPAFPCHPGCSAAPENAR